MSDIALKVREIGFPEGCDRRILEEATAIWQDATMRYMPELTAASWLDSLTQDQVGTAFRRYALTRHAVRM